MFAGIRAATAAPEAAPRSADTRLGVKRRPRPSVGLSERSERVETATQKSRDAKRFCRETQNGQRSVNFFGRWN